MWAVERADGGRGFGLGTATATEDDIQIEGLVGPADVNVTDEYLGTGYGQPTPETEEATI